MQRLFSFVPLGEREKTRAKPRRHDEDAVPVGEPVADRSWGLRITSDFRCKKRSRSEECASPCRIEPSTGTRGCFFGPTTSNQPTVTQPSSFAGAIASM